MQEGASVGSPFPFSPSEDPLPAAHHHHAQFLPGVSSLASPNMTRRPLPLST